MVISLSQKYVINVNSNEYEMITKITFTEEITSLMKLSEICISNIIGRWFICKLNKYNYSTWNFYSETKV